MIRSGSTIKAIGTESKRIQFIGAYEGAGSWQGIHIESNTDNQLAYCDFLNMGSWARNDIGGLQLLGPAKVGISHCKFTNGLGTGLHARRSNNCQITAFDHNIFEGYENFPPVVLESYQSLSSIEKFDMTSDFTNNAKKYIQITPDLKKDVTINQTTVPYYFDWEMPNFNYHLTINEGVTIYMAHDLHASSGILTGRLTINGTADKKVKFTRLPSSSNYWGNIAFNGLCGSEINHCIFEYGGFINGGYSSILYITRGAELTLNNVEINNSATYGIRIAYCDYQLTHNNVTFSNNGIANVRDECADPPVDRDDLP